MARFVPKIVAAFLVSGLVAGILTIPAGAVSSPYHPDTVLVKFQLGVSDAVRSAAHVSIGGQVANTISTLNLDVVRLSNGLDPAAVAVQYSQLPGVVYSQPNWKVRLFGTPNDALFKDEWGLHNTDQLVTGSLVNGRVDADIDAPEGWDLAFGTGLFESTGGTRVGIIDTGIDQSHIDLVGKTKACAGSINALGVVVENDCQDGNFHGTHVAGTIGAATNNAAGVAGVAPNAEFAIFKAFNSGGVAFTADIIAGMQWMRTKSIKVLSMSFGGTANNNAEHDAIKNLSNDGVLLVAAAGNDGDTTANYPAIWTEVMSVAATNQADAISSFSTCNSDVEIAAPGEDIWSTFPGNTYGLISGTSMATPHVAGVAALVISEKGTSASQTRTQLVNSAVAVFSNGGRSACNGLKRVNLAAAVGGTAPPPPPPSPGAISGKVVESGKNKTPLAQATVNCGAAGSASTASDGTYTISNVTPGTYSCTASKTGYVSKSSNVTVSSGATTTADFALRRA